MRGENGVMETSTIGGTPEAAGEVRRRDAEYTLG